MSIQETISQMAMAAKKASRNMANLSTTAKNNALLKMAEALLAQKTYIDRKSTRLNSSH